jgi:hypothetical protein
LWSVSSFFWELHGTFPYFKCLWVEGTCHTPFSWIGIQIPLNVFEFNWFKFESNSIHSKFNKIQFKLHVMSFNIFIRMELNFHKINSFFYQLINWLWLVVRSKSPSCWLNEYIMSCLFILVWKDMYLAWVVCRVFLGHETSPKCKENKIKKANILSQYSCFFYWRNSPNFKKF